MIEVLDGVGRHLGIAHERRAITAVGHDHCPAGAGTLQQWPVWATSAATEPGF